MQLFAPRCIKKEDSIKCAVCNNHCVKNGKSANGQQRFRCVQCKRNCQQYYHYMACQSVVNKWIINCLREGCGIRSIARLLQISVGTVLSRILKIARTIRKPAIVFGKNYELDELCTYVVRKDDQYWVAYAICRDTREVVDFTVGSRTKKTLRQITDTLLLAKAKKIYTDKLVQYRTIIPGSIHRTSLHGTNHIERMNLTLRTHLKRLNRRTICFSKSIAMLVACLKIYFWN